MKKYKLLILFIVIFSLISCNSSTEKEKVSNNNSTSKEILSNPTKVDYSSIKSLDMTKDTISIFIDGEKIELNSSTYLNKNRYYICLNEIVDLLKGSYEKENNIIKIKVKDKNYIIDIDKSNITTNNETYPIKKLLTVDNEYYYIDFCDFSKMLDLYTKWDKETKTIYCKVNGNLIDNVPQYTSKIDTLGFLRLEDVALTVQPVNNDYFEKIRVIGNYLAKRNVPYHIAWIPRPIYPSQNLDLDPMKRNDFATAEMVYSLQYITEHNGLIGLHGYTHQSGNEDSGIGFEFGYNYPDTTRFRERITAAIETAKYLDIPISFFETPHYAITPEQNKIAEEYFKILYYPLKDSNVSTDLCKPQLSPYNNSSYYVSTPLDYIKSDNVDNCIEALNNCNTEEMGSIFYHPFHELDYISFSIENNIPNYIYQDNSPLKRVVNILENKGFKLSKVSDIN